MSLEEVDITPVDENYALFVPNPRWVNTSNARLLAERRLSMLLREASIAWDTLSLEDQESVINAYVNLHLRS